MIELTWLGQSGFVLRAGGCAVVVDAFLSPHPDRAYPPPLDPAELRGLDAIVCTHDHLDHLDPAGLPVLAEASPGAVVVVPEQVVRRVVDLGIAAGRVRGAAPGEAIAAGEAVLHPLPACHAAAPEDGYTLGPFLGFVIELGGVRVWHAGDTIDFDGLAEQAASLRPDVALLPINGRDAEREALGLAGNLDAAEAVALAAAAGAGLIVPTHWDLFPANPGRPELAVELARTTAPRLSVLVPARGRPWSWG